MSEDKTYKFVTLDETSLSLDSIIQQENQNHYREHYSSVFDPSHVTECPRRIIFRSNGMHPDKSFSYLDIHHRTFIKDKWIDYFKKCKSIRVVGSHVVAADCHYNISGSVDGVINMGDRNYVTQIQSVCSSDFDKINKKGALKKHVVEVIVYMWLTELKDGLLLYENQDDNKYAVFHIKPYEPIIKSVRKKCTDLMEDKIQGIIPNRPYEDKDSSECIVCEFNNECWKEKSKND